MTNSTLMKLRGPIECVGYGKRPSKWRARVVVLMCVLCAVALWAIATTDRCERADKIHTACAK